MFSLFKMYVGRFWNLLGVPAIVRECDYYSDAMRARVVVKKLDLFTVITVNGVDVYFNRISGGIDGVGASQASDCTFPERQMNSGISARCFTLPKAEMGRTQTSHKRSPLSHCRRQVA